MKRQKPQNTQVPRHASFSRRPLPTIFGLLLLAVAGIIVAKVIVSLTSPEFPAQTDPPIDSSVNTTTNNTSTDSSTPSKNTTKPKVVQYEGDDPNTSDALSGTITAARISGDSFIIRVNIDQFLSSGVCELTMSRDDAIHTDSALIVPSASTSTCEGFDVPLRALGSGTYQIDIFLSSDDKTGHITSEVSL